MKVGDIVKSLDFNGIDNCYMVGKVVSISKINGTFRAKLINRVWEGKICRKHKTDYFVAPLQGNYMTDNDSSIRVMVIG